MIQLLHVVQFIELATLHLFGFVEIVRVLVLEKHWASRPRTGKRGETPPPFRNLEVGSVHGAKHSSLGPPVGRKILSLGVLKIGVFVFDTWTQKVDPNIIVPVFRSNTKLGNRRALECHLKLCSQFVFDLRMG